MICVEYCLFCDICGTNWPDSGDASMPPTERRRRAKRNGWSQRNIEGERCDLCPGCSDDHQDYKSQHRRAPTFIELMEMARKR